MKIYLAGPMRGIPHFNHPAFHAAAAKLRAEGHEVFSPAELDLKMHGAEFGRANAAGDEKQAAQQFGFNLREALAADLAWICREADGIALLPNWRNSKGSCAEHATAVALDLQVLEL